MTEPAKEGPSTRALRQLNNRNNLAGLKLRKTLEQFDREKSFSISVLDRDKFDTRDFLKNVKYCDSDYLPQSRSFLGTPNQRRLRSHTAKTAPCRMHQRDSSQRHSGNNGGTHTDVSDDETLVDDVTESENHDGGSRGGRRAPVMMNGTKLLASRKSASAAHAFKLSEYQKAEKFLRRLREQVAVEELYAHYTDEDYSHLLNAVVSKISRTMTPSLGAPSVTAPHGPTLCPMKREAAAQEQRERDRKDSHNARFDMVYPVKLLANIETKYEYDQTKTPARSPSPSLGFGSPGIRATPLGVLEGGAIGLGSRLVVTAPQALPAKPWTPFSLDALRAKTQSQLDFCMMRAALRSGIRRKPLNQRVQDFCKELDDIRSRNRPASQSVDGNNNNGGKNSNNNNNNSQKEERRKNDGGVLGGYSAG